MTHAGSTRPVGGTWYFDEFLPDDTRAGAGQAIILAPPLRFGLVSAHLTEEQHDHTH